MKQVLFFIGLFIFQTTNSQVSYTWNGSVSTSWNTPGNWTPAGVPGATDNVTIVTAANTCTLSASMGINNLTLNSGTLDLGGFTLTANGATALLNAGTVQGGGAAGLLSMLTTTTTFAAGPLTMNCKVNVNSQTVTVSHTTFQDVTTITKTGATNDGSVGANVFNGPTTVINLGSGYLMLANGNPDRFNSSATFNNMGSGTMYIADNSTGNIFNGVATFNNSPTGNTQINVSRVGIGTQFNNNIIVSSTNGQGVQFCNGGLTPTATLAAGNTINIGAGGFSAGTLLLRQFIQTGTTAQSLNLTGSAVLTFGPASTFNGDVTTSSPTLNLNGCTFNGAATCTKTGASNDNSTGNNIFNGVTIITNAGSNLLSLANGAPDQFNSTTTFNNTGTSHLFVANNSVNNIFNGVTTFNNTPAANTLIYVSQSSAGTVFNNNVVVNSTSGQGIQFCTISGTATLAAGNTISAGSFTSGILFLRHFTQAGITSQNISLTGAGNLTFGPSSSFGGDVISTSPSLLLNGCTFNGTTNLKKTGASGDLGAGANIFNGVCTITNSGSSFLGLGNNNPDIWNDDVTFTDNGSDRILPGWGSAGNQFNGNIYLNTSGSATGIQFCGGNGTATATLAATKSILAGGSGLNAGYVILKQFTQLGTAPVNLPLSSTATHIQFGPASTIGGNLTSTSPGLFFNGCIFGGTVTSTKTGTTNDVSIGNNIFNGVTNLTNAGSGYIILGNGNADIWNDDVTFNTSGTSYIGIGWLSPGNMFYGNINVSSSGTALGIQFCAAPTSTATLAATKTIQVGAGGFNAGYLILRQFTQLGNTPINLPFGSTAGNLQFGPSSTIGGNVISTSPGLYFNGCTFGGTVASTKTGANNDVSIGNNIFNGATTITNAGPGLLQLGVGNRDQFNSSSTFNNTGSGSMYVAHNSFNNIFNGVATFNNSPSANTSINVSWLSAGTIFNNNIVVTSTNGQGVQFCGGNVTSNVTLAAGNTISVGGGGFSAGTLLLKQFTQTGATAQNLLLTGTGNLTYGPSSSFGGNIISSSPAVLLNGCTFNGTSDITKTGAIGDNSIGGNIFNGVCSITNNGNGYLILGNINPDIWNNDVTVTNSGAERILACYGSAGNQFNGNIYVNTSGSAIGIQFCGLNATATATLAATKTIQPGIIGLNKGYLILKQFTQLGNAPVNLPLSSTAGYLQFGPASTLGGNLTSTSPGLYFNGCTFNGTATCTKTGSASDASTGNNVFNGVTTINDSGTGYLIMGNGAADIWNDDVTFNNSGASYLGVAWNSAGNLFNGNIYASTSGSAIGIQFCVTPIANATLAATKTVLVGSGGFNAGYLVLRQFTQLGNAPVNLSFGSTAGFLQFGPSSIIGGNVISSSPGLFFNGCTFNGSVTSTKTGPINDNSSGNNIFNGVATMTDSGPGFLSFGNGNRDQFNTTATFNNTGSSSIYVANNSANNIFNGVTTFNNTPSANTLIFVSQLSAGTIFNNNIVVTSTGGQGVQFCSGNLTSTAMLTAGNTISVGAGGFSAGILLLKQFTQTGATIQSLPLTGTGNLTFGPSSFFGGNVTSTSAALFFNGCIFNGNVNSTKTGTTNDQSQGNNIFNAPGTFINNGIGYLLMTLTTPDAYNSNVTFIQNSTGAVYPNYNGNSNYSGNIDITSPSATAITFGANTGTATLNGTSLQKINATAGTAIPIFSRLIVNNTGGAVTLNTTSINVSKALSLVSGLLNTTTTYILTMLNASTVAVGDASSTSYVNGPMRYQKSSAGFTTLNFPIGSAADSRPAALTVNHTTGNLYTYQAQVFNASAKALGYTLPPTIDRVSQIHYYTISRVNAASVNQPTLELNGNQTIQLFFGANDIVTDGSELVIAKNTYLTPTAWIDIGGSGGPAYNGGAYLSGDITSTSSPAAFNSFSTFTLANHTNGVNNLPVQLLFFNAAADKHKVDLSWSTSTELNNRFFTVEKSNDAVNFLPLQNVNTKALNGNSNITLNYLATDTNPYTGVSYYRLKQTDIDGHYKYSRIASVNFDEQKTISVYPNPTTGIVFVSGLAANEKKITIEWYDASGILLAHENSIVRNGIAKLETHFRNGVFLLKIICSDGTVHSQNVIIMK